MVALASGFARSPRALAGARIRDRRLRHAARSRLRPIILRRVRASTSKTRLPGVAPRLRRRATRRLRRLSLPSAPPAVSTSAASVAFASSDADAVAFAPAVAEEVSGRVASRPGYPAEPAARSRPFGRVSLAPPFASLTARSACPGGSLRSPPLAFPPPPWVAPALRSFRRCRLIALALRAWRASASRPDRSRAAAAALRFGSRTGFPDVLYPGSGPSHALRRLGSHTPRTWGAVPSLSARTTLSYAYAPKTAPGCDGIL